MLPTPVINIRAKPIGTVKQTEPSKISNMDNEPLEV